MRPHSSTRLWTNRPFHWTAAEATGRPSCYCCGRKMEWAVSDIAVSNWHSEKNHQRRL